MIDGFGFWNLLGYVSPLPFGWVRSPLSSDDLVSVFRLTVEGLGNGKDTYLWLRWRYRAAGSLALRDVTRAERWYPDKQASVWLPYQAPLFHRQSDRPLTKELEVMAVPLRGRTQFTPYQIRIEELIA